MPTTAAGCCPSLLDAPMTEDQAVETAPAFGALADPVRLRLLGMLAAAPDGEVCACALVDPLGRAQPTVSHHLKVLADAGLVTSEKRGRWVWYRVDRDRLAELQAVLG